jgi:hypothetical protein
MKGIPYFGHKQGLLPYYPRPEHDLIIEAFAGTARYACRYGLNCNVWLNDKYFVMAEIWRWIQKATRKDIKSLPSLAKAGQSLHSCTLLSDPERWLLGFATGVGRTVPSQMVTTFGESRGGTDALKHALLRLCGRIGHWKITNVDYRWIPNQEATWFVDPPYQFMGHHYAKHRTISFKHLGQWCRERSGQLIACEGQKHGGPRPNWMPFENVKTDIRRFQSRGSYSELKYCQSNRHSNSEGSVVGNLATDQ